MIWFLQFVQPWWGAPQGLVLPEGFCWRSTETLDRFRNVQEIAQSRGIQAMAGYRGQKVC